MQAIPTLKQLYDDYLASLEAEYNVTIPLVGKNFLRAIAAVQSAKTWLLYQALRDIQKNVFVDYADPVSKGGTLERFGLIKLGRNPFLAVAGSYTLTVTGSTGAVIPASQTFKSNDDSLNPGIIYVLDTAYTMPGSTGTITVRALTPGLTSKLNIADKLTSTSPIILVDSTATVASEVISPLDAEDIEDYRLKAIQAYRLEPQGGSGSDYRLWANEVQGVRTAYPYAKSGAANEINIFVEAVFVDSIDGMGTPSAGMLSDVQNSVELPTVDRPGRKPLGVYAIHYLPITVRQVDIEIVGFVGLTAAIQVIILQALEDYLFNVRSFVASVDVLSDKNDTVSINTLIYQVQLANPQSVFTAINLSVDSVPLTSYQFVDGDIPTLNSVTYV